MTLLPLLHDRMGFDAIYAQSVIVVLCGVAIEAGLFIIYLGFSGDLQYARMSSEVLFPLAVVGAYFLVTASLGYGLAFALCQSLDLRPWLGRVVALMAAPLCSGLAAVVVIAVMEGFNGGEFDNGPAPVEVLFMATLFSYATLGLPLLAAAVLAARTIRKTRVNAEAVFGGTN
ncbi:hypothetical protein [Stagnihabitans tardus]|uniref:Uncharacterized protein n=1 Tax=Stagnihabitans tardus TaxID=2699202 RepID=A0AAE4Y9D5_9RHOB|nr:hypothetical protein [Stagnihabitans tardus]NBZ86159.1 hypothetical protein [Stagnihabitans tardus]